MNKVTIIMEKLMQDIISKLNLSLFQTGIKPRSLMKQKYITQYIPETTAISQKGCWRI